MRPVAAAVRAVLHQLEPVGVVAPVLAGDVVAVLAFLAGQRDLGPNVCRSHEGVPFSRTDFLISSRTPGVGGEPLPLSVLKASRPRNRRTVSLFSLPRLPGIPRA